MLHATAHDYRERWEEQRSTIPPPQREIIEHLLDSIWTDAVSRMREKKITRSYFSALRVAYNSITTTAFRQCLALAFISIKLLQLSLKVSTHPNKNKGYFLRVFPIGAGERLNANSEDDVGDSGGDDDEPIDSDSESDSDDSVPEGSTEAALTRSQAFFMETEGPTCGTAEVSQEPDITPHPVASAQDPHMIAGLEALL